MTSIWLACDSHMTCMIGIWISYDWHDTVATFLLYLGQKVSSWNYKPFFIQYHRICNGLILKVHNLRISPKNTPKTMKKSFLDPTGFEPGTFRLWDLHATKELWRLAVLGGNFLWYFKKIACVQKISAILTSQSWKLEKK